MKLFNMRSDYRIVIPAKACGNDDRGALLDADLLRFALCQTLFHAIALATARIGAATFAAMR